MHTAISKRNDTGMAMGVLLRPVSKRNSACIGNKSTKSIPILFVKSTPASMLHAVMPDYTPNAKRCRLSPCRRDTTRFSSTACAAVTPTWHAFAAPLAWLSCWIVSGKEDVSKFSMVTISRGHR